MANKKKMKKGGMTNDEKLIVIGMYYQNYSIDEIVEKTRRSERAVLRTLENANMLANIPNNENEKDNSQDEKSYDNEQKSEIKRTSSKVKKEAIGLLMDSGMSKGDAYELIEHTEEKEPKKVWKTGKGLFESSMSYLKAKHLMGRRSSSGKQGVAVMTGASSQRGDERGKQSRSGNKVGKSRKHIHNIRENS